MPKADETLDVHVVLDGVGRQLATRILREMLYHIEREDTPRFEGMGPGYAGFVQPGTQDSHSPVVRLRRSPVPPLLHASTEEWYASGGKCARCDQLRQERIDAGV